MTTTVLSNTSSQIFSNRGSSSIPESFSSALASTHATRLSSLSYLTLCINRLGPFATPQLLRIYEEGKKEGADASVGHTSQISFDSVWIRATEDEISKCAQTFAKTIPLSSNVLQQISRLDHTATIRKNLGILAETAVRRGHACDRNISLGDRARFKMSCHFMKDSSVQIEWQRPFFIGFKKKISRLFYLQEERDSFAKAYVKAMKVGVTPEQRQTIQVSLEKEALVSSLLHSEDTTKAMPGEKYLLKIEKVFHEKAPSLFKGIVMEYCQCHDISSLPDPSLHDRKQRIKIAYQLALALATMHNKGICHLDVKPENVFLTTDEEGQFSVRLGDFEFSEKIGTAIEKNTGTLIFLPPEAFTPQDRRTCLPSVDMWGFGLTLLELAHGKQANPFYTKLTRSIFSELPNVIQEIWKTLYGEILGSLNPSDPLDKLIRDLLRFSDPESRPTAQQSADRLFAIMST